MRPNWQKLAGLALKTWQLSCFQFSECIHCSQRSFFLESILLDNMIDSCQTNPCPAE